MTCRASLLGYTGSPLDAFNIGRITTHQLYTLHSSFAERRTACEKTSARQHIHFVKHNRYITTHSPSAAIVNNAADRMRQASVHWSRQ
jgi:hypothetical protein